jgi:hypothetical protein
VLQRVLNGRIVFTPMENGLGQEGYDFVAPTRYDKLFTGVAVRRPDFIPSGSEGTESIGPEDTHDGDHGRLLERAYGKGERPQPFRVGTRYQLGSRRWTGFAIPAISPHERRTRRNR